MADILEVDVESMDSNDGSVNELLAARVKKFMFALPSATIEPFSDHKMLSIERRCVGTMFACYGQRSLGDCSQDYSNEFWMIAGQSFVACLPEERLFSSAESNRMILAGARVALAHLDADSAERAWLVSRFPNVQWTVPGHEQALTAEFLPGLVNCFVDHLSIERLEAIVEVYIAMIVSFTQKGVADSQEFASIITESMTTMCSPSVEMMTGLWACFGCYFNEVTADAFFVNWDYCHGFSTRVLEILKSFTPGVKHLRTVQTMRKTFPRFPWESMQKKYWKEWEAFEKLQEMVAMNSNIIYKKNIPELNPENYLPFAYAALRMEKRYTSRDNWISIEGIGRKPFRDKFVVDSLILRHCPARSS